MLSIVIRRSALFLPVTALTLVLSLSLGLAACGDDAPGADPTTAETVAITAGETVAAGETPTTAGDTAATTVPEFRLGELRIGLPEASVLDLLGEPDSRTAPVEQAADAMFVSTWTWAAKGLVLVMAAESSDRTGSLSAITANAPSTLTTAEGIGIGSDESDVLTAYETLIDTEISGEGSLVVGSIYDGMILEFVSGKVFSIFVGAAAE